MNETIEGLPRPTAICRLKLIGHMEAWTAKGESVLPIGRKTRAMLAVIALSAPRPILRSRLAEMLWSRRHEEQARASLRQELHRLLEALHPLGMKIFDVTRDHIILRPGMVWIDVDQIVHATSDQASALALLEGELLEGFDDVDPALDQWLAEERLRLRDRARTVAEAVLGQQAEAHSAIPAAQRLLSIDRSHEGAWRALMHGYAARGERGKAIQAYEQCRGVLTDMLNAAPLPDTQRLAADIRAGHISAPTPSATETLPRPSRTPAAVRVGALPPQVISAGAEEAQFSLGLAEEVTVALTRFNSMVVVSPSSLSQLGERTESTIRSAFALDFLVDGSVQRAGTRLRITLRLLDLRNGSHVLWTYRTDQQMGDLLALQDAVSAEVAAQVDLEILRVEGRVATQTPSAIQTGQQLVLAAVPLMARLHADAFRQAGDMLDSALRLDPVDPAAHAWKAWWHILGAGQGWIGHVSQRAAPAVAHAERVLLLDPQNARAITIAGHVRAELQGRAADALQLHTRALAINPNLPMAWALSAIAHLYLGDQAQASTAMARYKQLSPSDPNAFFYDAYMGLNELLARNIEAAVTLGRRASELNPNFAEGLKHYLAALGHARQGREAAVVLARVIANEPRFCVQTYLAHSTLQRPSDRDFYAAGLRLAGVAESRSTYSGHVIVDTAVTQDSL